MDCISTYILAFIYQGNVKKINSELQMRFYVFFLSCVLCEYMVQLRHKHFLRSQGNLETFGCSGVFCINKQMDTLYIALVIIQKHILKVSYNSCAAFLVQSNKMLWGKRENEGIPSFISVAIELHLYSVQLCCLQSSIKSFNFFNIIYAI